MSTSTGLKALNPEMPDPMRWALESRLDRAKRVVAVIQTEADEMWNALRAADDSGSAEDMAQALGLLVRFAHSAGASGGMHSKIDELTAIAGAVEILSVTGALQNRSA